MISIKILNLFIDQIVAVRNTESEFYILIMLLRYSIKYFLFTIDSDMQMSYWLLQIKYMVFTWYGIGSRLQI